MSKTRFLTALRGPGDLSDPPHTDAAAAVARTKKKTFHDVTHELEAAAKGKGVNAVRAECALAALKRHARFSCTSDLVAALENDTHKKNPLGFGAEQALMALRQAGLLMKETRR